MKSVWDTSFAVEEWAGGLANTHTHIHQNLNMKTISAQDKVPQIEINEGEEAWSCNWLETRQSRRYEQTFTCQCSLCNSTKRNLIGEQMTFCLMYSHGKASPSSSLKGTRIQSEKDVIISLARCTSSKKLELTLLRNR